MSHFGHGNAHFPSAFRPQIKVRDLSNAKLSIEPADATSWSDVRTELIAEKKAQLRSELENELSAAADEAAVEKLRKDFSRTERMIEHDVDSSVHNFSATIDIDYKCVHFAHRTAFPYSPPPLRYPLIIQSSVPCSRSFLAK
jgi:hypothetical protein